VGRWPLVVAAAVAVSLAVWGGLDILNAVFTGTLIVLFPVVAVVQLRLVDLTTLPRRAAYLNSMTTILALGLVALGLGVWRFGTVGLGLVWPGTTSFVGWSLGLTAAGMAIVFAFVALRRGLGLHESDFLRHMLPRNTEDRRLFALLSLSAGIGEELVFRSYLIAVLAVVLRDPWLAASAAAVLFAAVHAYQGPVGLVRTAVLGVVLATPLLILGSIWPAIVAHTAIDLFGGLVFAERLVDPPIAQEGAFDGN